LTDALEESMKIEAMEGNLGSLRGVQTPNRCKYGATTRKNINAHREDSRIDDTQTRMTARLVYQMLHKRTYVE
jgi:hypothetical protein